MGLPGKGWAASGRPWAALAVLARPALVCTPSGLVTLDTVPAPDPLALNPADWDLMFRAALAFLQTRALERSTPEATRLAWQPPGMALAECPLALDQLRMAVPNALAGAPAGVAADGTAARPLGLPRPIG